VNTSMQREQTILRNGERCSARFKAGPNTIELVWMVPATEKGIQEIAGNEKMHLISPEQSNLSDRTTASGPRWRFAR